MQANKTFSGLYENKDGKVTVKLSVIFFNDTDSVISYCPALNVYGYGKDESDSKQSFETSLEEFFKYTMNKGTLFQELESLGWTITNSKKINPPAFSDLLKNNKEFEDIFNNHDFTKVDRVFEIPEAA